MKNGFEPSNIYSFSRRIRIRIQNWTKTSPRPDFYQFLKKYDFLKDFFLILGMSFVKWSSKEYFIYFGVKILCLINIFLEISLSIALAEAITPEWVYGIPIFSKIDWIYPSSPYWPCNALNIALGLNFLITLKEKI